MNSKASQWVEEEVTTQSLEIAGGSKWENKELKESRIDLGIMQPITFRAKIYYPSFSFYFR
jgi:hypothetical protein